MEHLVAQPECMHVLTSFVTPGVGFARQRMC